MTLAARTHWARTAPTRYVTPVEGHADDGKVDVFQRPDMRQACEGGRSGESR
jgi:hypothetical protein